ncbi:hypothetical protein HK100_004667 [Physocladia obscura]|uniref:Uncharacterized protein n=1 Tax=Physocladia obscura TaxID=109957 RepID=A0AAD5SSU4_9FUNG|nr:hypothetical protein HK100_004667 [Physocladia obscura]
MVLHAKRPTSDALPTRIRRPESVPAGVIHDGVTIRLKTEKVAVGRLSAAVRVEASDIVAGVQHQVAVVLHCKLVSGSSDRGACGQDPTLTDTGERDAVVTRE